MPLKPDFKAKTLAALRSDEYRQETICVGDFYRKRLCCIGVAAHANGLSAALDTQEASAFIGLTSEEQNQWVDWNDNKHLKFAEIADKIEAEY